MTENEKIEIAALLLVLFAGAAAVGVSLMQPRGIRNNNPGNLKELPGDSTRWLGERATDDDRIFEEFTAPVYGIRALARVLLNYSRNYGLDTVAGIIARFAPGTENDTAAYSRYVAARLGVAPTTRIDVENCLPDLVRAVIYYENGQQPYGAAVIAQAVDMAKGNA